MAYLKVYANGDGCGYLKDVRSFFFFCLVNAFVKLNFKPMITK